MKEFSIHNEITKDKKANSFDIKNEPNSQELWNGIGDNFDNGGQVICEFVDNSISNFVGHNWSQNNIRIYLKYINQDKIKVVVEDSGTGIINLDKAFTLGARECAESTYSEHGFGMKHALASANPGNDAWAIYTRTEEDLKKGIIKKISSPYKIKDYKGEILSNDEWPEEGQYHGTGTIVIFECDWAMFAALGRGIKGTCSRFDTLCDILYEDLGFIYANLIENETAHIELIMEDLNNHIEKRKLTALKPCYEKDIKPGKGTAKHDLGGGDVTIKYHFGVVAHPDIAFPEGRKNYDNSSRPRKYYNRNMSSSGLELRINGRVVEYNLFKEVWETERHNSYNYLLVQIDLISDNIDALPCTRTSKNGLREGDVKLDKLYEWIRKHLKAPTKNLKDTDRETDIFQTLKKIKEAQIEYEPKTIETERTVFDTTGDSKDRERIDLYVNYGENTIIYEGKKDKTTAKDVYQLRMYWDGLVFENIHPTKGILIASSHSSGVKTLIGIVNEMKDSSGNPYNFVLKTWEDEFPNGL